MLRSVLFPFPLPPLVFNVGRSAKVGELVVANVKGREEVGVVWSAEGTLPEGRKPEEARLTSLLLPHGMLRFLKALENVGVPPQYALRHVPLRHLLESRPAHDSLGENTRSLEVLNRKDLRHLRGKRFIYFSHTPSRTPVPLPEPFLVRNKTKKFVLKVCSGVPTTAVGFVSAAFSPFPSLDGIILDTTVPYVRLGRAEISTELLVSLLAEAYGTKLFVLKRTALTLYSHLQLPVPPPKFENCSFYVKKTDSKTRLPWKLLSLLENGHTVSVVAPPPRRPVCPKCFSPLKCPECGSLLTVVRNAPYCEKCGLVKSAGFCSACEETVNPKILKGTKRRLDEIKFLFGDSVSVCNDPEEAENEVLFYLFSAAPSKPSQLPWAWSKIARALNTSKPAFFPEPKPDFVSQPEKFIADQSETRKKRKFPPFGLMVKGEFDEGPFLWLGEKVQKTTHMVGKLRKIKVDSGFFGGAK